MLDQSLQTDASNPVRLHVYEILVVLVMELQRADQVETEK